MTLQELFNYLQEHKSCKLVLPDVRTAENLRVMLVKKWSREKQSREDLGFLMDDVRYLSVSMEHGTVLPEDEGQEFIFHLRPRSRSKVEYQILPVADKENGNG